MGMLYNIYTCDARGNFHTGFDQDISVNTEIDESRIVEMCKRDNCIAILCNTNVDRRVRYFSAEGELQQGQLPWKHRNFKHEKEAPMWW